MGSIFHFLWNAMLKRETILKSEEEATLACRPVPCTPVTSTCSWLLLPYARGCINWSSYTKLLPVPLSSVCPIFQYGTGKVLSCLSCKSCVDFFQVGEQTRAASLAF